MKWNNIIDWYQWAVNLCWATSSLTHYLLIIIGYCDTDLHSLRFRNLYVGHELQGEGACPLAHLLPFVFSIVWKVYIGVEVDSTTQGVPNCQVSITNLSTKFYDKLNHTTTIKQVKRHGDGDARAHNVARSFTRWRNGAITCVWWMSLQDAAVQKVRDYILLRSISYQKR